MKKFDYIAHDGKRIVVFEWEVENPKGIVQLSHGMIETITRYDELARYLNSKGYVVFGDDHRGHGLTDVNNLGWCEGDMFEDTLKDLSGLTKLYREQYPSLPLYFLGHSYGSFLTQAYIERYSDLIDKVIIGGSSYMKGDAGVALGSLICALKSEKGLKKQAKFLHDMSLGAYSKNFKEGNFISSIVEECEIQSKHEYCSFICSYNFYKGFFKGLKGAYKKDALESIRKDLPILLMAGAEDPVGKFGKGIEQLYAMYHELGLDVEMILYDGVRHEYFHDTSKEQAFADVLEFIEN